jgi:hypothetical protein
MIRKYPVLSHPDALLPVGPLLQVTTVARVQPSSGEQASISTTASVPLTVTGC